LQTRHPMNHVPTVTFSHGRPSQCPILTRTRHVLTCCAHITASIVVACSPSAPSSTWGQESTEPPKPTSTAPSSPGPGPVNHWAFEAMSVAEAPDVSTSEHAGCVRNGIDAFILVGLEQEDLAP